MELPVSSSSSSPRSMSLQGDEILSRKLAQDFQALKINVITVKSMEFEELAIKIGSSDTLKTTKSLLDCLEHLFSSFKGDLDHLLKRLASPKHKVTRYPVRVMLCAYMILGHPDGIFNRQGDLETLLSKSATNMIGEFEKLIKIILDGLSFRGQLKCFDASWCSYLERFVRWKVKDVKSLEEDLVSMACKMELSMMETCKLSVAGDENIVSLTHDKEAVKEQVICDQRILREKVRQLTGEAGVERMESALSETRSKYFQAKEKETSPVVSPGGSQIDNELLVNEIIHEKSHGFSNRLDVKNDDANNQLKAKIKETMEKAFWDSIEESLKQDEPDYGRVVELVKEVRDELCSIAPSWKENIFDSIDIYILSQVLTSGTRDLSYLENVLQYALTTLRKLSSPASESEMIKTHKNLMDELSERANPSLVIVKGMRFVLEEIQNLKKEINKAHIRLLEPVIQGQAGFDYLRKAFANCYGSPANVCSSLPVTVKWILSAQSIVDQEWTAYTESLTQKGLPPHTTLQTGRSISGPVTTTNTKTTHQPECSGDKVDKMVRLGLLNLASGIQGITEETIPETLKLNLSRLWNSQEQLQQIIVVSTSILVLRQTVFSEKSTATENVVAKFVDRLKNLLSRSQDVGIKDIVDTMPEEDMKCSPARKEVMANMLVKSLRPDDPVFGMVSRSVYAAARGIMFGGSGLQGRKIAETELRKLGASVLTDKLVEVVGVLIVLATVSSNVHRPWYVEITKSL